MKAIDVKNFLAGFINGAGSTTVGSCGSALSTIISVGYKVAMDFEVPNQNLQQDINTLNDMQTLVSSFAPLNTCNFAQLDDQLALILTKGGYKILIENYLNNGPTIFNDYKTIVGCSANYTLCGTAAGNAFKTLVGWTLN